MKAATFRQSTAGVSISPKSTLETNNYSKQPSAPILPSVKVVTPEVQDQLANLFVLVRSEFGNDLTYYKPATVERRIIVGRVAREEPRARRVRMPPRGV